MDLLPVYIVSEVRTYHEAVISVGILILMKFQFGYHQCQMLIGVVTTTAGELGGPHVARVWIPVPFLLLNLSLFVPITVAPILFLHPWFPTP